MHRSRALLRAAVLLALLAGVAVAHGAGRPALIAVGDARSYAARGAQPGASAAIVGMAATPDGRGYWLASARGQLFAYGDARALGAATPPSGDHVVGVATSRGGGCWLATRGGKVLAVGSAPALGGSRSSSPSVAIASTPDGGGYWTVAASGHVSAFGDARSYGSAGGGLRDVVGMAVARGGRGYWLVSAAGGVLRFGDAGFHGSALGAGIGPVVGIAATADGGGYWIAAASGRVLAFGDATGSPSASPSNAVAIAATQSGRGYWLLGGGPVSSALPAPGPGFLPGHVTAIGDSVMLDAAPTLAAAIPGIDVQASVSRQWDAGVALAATLKAEHRLGAQVVVDLGNNGPVTAAQLDSMMTVLAGASAVVFVTVHLPPTLSWSSSVNATLRAGVARHPRARLADFNAIAERHPQWFAGDGVHMAIGGPGAQALAATIKAALR